MSYLTEVISAKSFLNGQLELYKIKYIDSDNNKYLNVMNELNTTLNTLNKMDDTIIKLLKENKRLKDNTENQ